MTAAPPALPEPFAWRDGQIAIDLPGGHALFTTRRPTDGGATIDLLAGPEALAVVAGVAPARLVHGPQVHGARVRVIAAEPDLDGPPPEADAVVTTLRDVAVAVRVADCLPVALVAPGAVAAVHAGWRGLAAGVLGAAVRALRACGAGEVVAAIGPGARVCCYETGPEVHAAFAQLGPRARRGSHTDLAAVAVAMLEDDDVRDIHDTGLCTICAPGGLLWSWRRHGAGAGRQGGVAWRS